MSFGSALAPGLFAGQLILVVGGGSGIGRCAARELASLGAHVVLVGRKAEKLTKVAAEIEAADACALAREAVRDLAADAARRARDQYHQVLQHPALLRSTLSA